MAGFARGRRGMPSARSSAVIIVGSFLLLTALAPVSSAAAPHPSEGSATVDGSTGDWSLSSDFFSDMTDAGVATRPVRAKLYLQYDCESEVLYALVLAQGDEKARQDRTDEAYIRIDGSGKLISATHNNDGTPPDFAWVNGDGARADGWEGSGPLAPGTYTLRAHVLIADDSADGYTPMDTVGREVPLEIECGGVGPTQGTPTPTPAATPTPTPAATPTPTPAPTGGQQTPTPTPAPTSGQQTPTPAPTGGVAPTTATSQAPTLPPTDASALLGSTSSQDGIRLVAVLLGAAVGTCLLFTPRRRRLPIERPIEPPTEPLEKTSEEDTEQQ
jgi:hypothetical protein